MSEMVKKTGVFLALEALVDVAGTETGHHALHLHISQRLDRVEELHIFLPLSSGDLACFSFLAFPLELYLSYSFYENLTSAKFDELNKNFTKFLCYFNNSHLTNKKAISPAKTAGLIALRESRK